MRESEAAAPIVVLDTNVFVAAGFNPRSASSRIVEAVRSGRLRMAWSPVTRGETERVLERIPPLSWAPFAPLFRAADRRDDPPADPGRYAAVADPEDRKFAALAHASGALLVTADDHLLSARDTAGLPVLTARDFVERWGDRLG